MKTLANRVAHVLFLLLTTFFLLAAFSSQTFAQGKKIYVGTGSGFIDYPTAQVTLNLHDDDTVMINPGKYKNMTFKNITASPGHKIYIMNSGQVEFNDPQPSWFSNLTNVEIRGDGTPGIDFGFYMHDLVRGIYIDGTMTSVYFSYIKMVNIGDYSIFFFNPSLHYDGTNNPNSLFYDIKFLHFSVYNIATTFLQIGVYTRLVDDGMINMMRKLEVAYCTIDYTAEEDVLHLDKVVNANIHHNRFSHLGKNDYRHTGIVYLYGNGDVHHNYISDYWGSGLRAHGFSLDTVGAVNVYDNIMVNSRKYSAVEAQITPEDLQVSPYLHYCNYKIYNNTFGNLSAYDWNCSMVDTYDAVGGTIEIKNNLGFNIQRDLPYNPNWNYIFQKLNLADPDTANNLYSRNYTDLGLKEDTSCFLNINSPAIDKGQAFSSIKDDIDGIVRPQGKAFDIGAREYVTGVVYPVSNAGRDTSTVLPKDSLSLNGTASYNPGGGALTYKWTQVTGPSTALFVSDSSAMPLLKKLIQGTYQLKLTVTNSLGRSSDDIVVVNVSPVPVYPPVAHAGGTTTITLPVNSTGLNGSASTSTAGLLKYAWTKTSGPASFTISGDTTATPFISSLTAGTYTITLTVTDTNKLVNTDVATVIVKPAPVPVANAGTDIYLVLPINTATLDGSASTSPGGGSLRYAWTKVSGPASFAISGDTTVTPFISNLTAGTYQVKLTVTNTSGITNSDFVNITVAATPVPVANAGTDINLVLPVNTATLNGTASTSPGGGSLTYAWSLISGPGTFTITGENTATPKISDLSAGVYHIKLEVTNTQGSAADDTVAVTVSSMPVYPPVSNAGPDVAIALPTNSTTLNGEQSYNPGGGALTYAWTLLSGPSSFTITGASTATPVISNLTAGAYQVQLKVTNTQGASSEDQVTITVSPAPAVPPVASAGADITLTLPANTATLDGSGSSNPAGGALTYAWSLASGPSSFTITGETTATPSISNLVQGVYQVKLIVTNTQGLSAEDVISVTVNALVYPVASAGSNIDITLPVNSATLNGSASYNPGGGAISYSWSKVSGPSSFAITGETTATPVISNLAEGVYQLALTVTNELGTTAQNTVAVTVHAAANPVADAGSAVVITLPINSVTLNGSASYNPDGSAVSYSWSKLSGPFAFTITGNTTATPVINNLIAGIYQVQLTVTNTSGLTATAVVNITVNPALLPVADAGKDTTITFPGGGAILNGSNSYGTGGATIAGYEWQQLSGPTTAAIANSITGQTTAANLEPGVYVFRLTITDNNGQQAAAQVKVTVTNALRYDKVITVYPNPCSEILHVRMISDSTGSAMIRITSMPGVILIKHAFQKNQLLVDEAVTVSRLPAGMYIVEVIIGKEVQLLDKFIKR